MFFLLLLLHFYVSTVHVNNGDMEVQKKKKENEGLGKTRKESNSSTKQALWEEKEQNRWIEKCSTFIFLPAFLLSTLHCSNSLEQCSNTREFSTRVLLCPTGSLAWASDGGGLAGFCPAHIGWTGSDPNLNALTWVCSQPKCTEPDMTQ